MRNALVIGANGQDGSYLAEHLLAAGWRVTGIGRQPTSRFLPDGGNFEYIQTDLTSRDGLDRVLESRRPSRMYHFAAIHGSSGFQYEDKFDAALKVNTESVHTCLEHMRVRDPGARLLYASSLKVFGETTPAHVHEAVPRRSECLYSITKNAANDLIAYYRKHHALRASVLYFSNHESPRRPAQFFVPSIVAALANGLRGSGQVTTVKTLDFACDWGSALEYMEIGSAILERDENDDFVVASGRTWTGLEFVDSVFEAAGLSWQRHIAVENAPGTWPITRFQIDISHLTKVLGYGPGVTAVDVAYWILREQHGIERLPSKLPKQLV